MSRDGASTDAMSRDGASRDRGSRDRESRDRESRDRESRDRGRGTYAAASNGGNSGKGDAVVSGRRDAQSGSGAGTTTAPAEPGRVRTRPPRQAAGGGPAGPRRPVTARPARPPASRPAAARPAAGRAVTAGPATARPVTTRPATARPGPGRTGTRRPGLGRPGRGAPGRLGSAGTAGSLRRVGAAAARRPSSRTSFILLVVGLLGGGLLSLLIINTTLAAGSYQISALQKSDAAQTQQIATLSQQVAADRSPATIEQRALQLGMVHPPLSHYVDLKTGRIISEPSTDPGIPGAPGWSP
jgi:hypothetical protein